jgi:hypothetical protein
MVFMDKKISPAPRGHIHFERILAFASESANFTDKENAHFEVCRNCRLKVIYALKNMPAEVVRTITAKAA